ncbi:UDP-N-acetylmuramoyl-L-alanyl-D-glutamate--2,6-diaminopimelate ligase [Pseudoxanthomonas winnipegensis]|uniref:UDP-N-acetylmuramoyl-L-alanyl-D-glutamate--2,6-diaminopimelate ligase n=1 Tax=Pseudoxanthomonas winnipegensis TaxID=2480810 RepID=A0A4Q8LTU1_9GAMM|nr:UDP-N-acetylmuramoyl-L-alanyl-D-glutamate--2,6-diaminopimelate ligase [Pseudoxanthomonas winnipegensis]RZZ83055.1 UDP-N-acetylmuramoyl-L-alanyl-D-glutamate--2,6-diaminopimelate ligase [Pseudoxanthomonas winnipegensis]TAA35396.1 UDP-N-acetylmuramoyl-L-alanyl-D-glutamate--2,6-diaminopimelate ligase [Pseudoxanthomonas winnipegensis]
MSRAMALSALLPDVPAVPAGLVVHGLTQDSRSVRPGDAFVAIGPVDNSPSTWHGLGFVEQARAAGAAAILFEPPAPDTLPAPADAIAVPGLRHRLGAMADTFYGHPSRQMTVVGVTGTNGKTSFVQLLGQAWHLLGVTGGSIGTLGAGLYGQVQPTGFTTPLVLQTHALLAQLHEAGAQAVAMEVSSHALVQTRVDAVAFDVAVFTNLTRDHLDYHGTMEGYGAAKARLFQRAGLRAAVVNLDDAFGATLPGKLADGVQLVGVSALGAAQAAVQARDVVLDASGIGFSLALGDAVHPVRSPLLGRFNVDNLLAVAGVLHATGIAPPRIAQVLGQLRPIHGRMNRLGGANGQPLVVIDYAHTPDALQQALTSLRGHLEGRLICVFGCGGDRDRGKRPQMARIAQQHADAVIVTDDNPRSEDGDAIVADIVAGFDAHGVRFEVQRDRARAIAHAVSQAQAGDIVLIAGKGHEPYQEVHGVRHAFDDTVQARAALEARATLDRDLEARR